MDPELSALLLNVIRASSLAVLPPVLVLLWRWRKLSKAQRFFGWVLIAVALVQVASLAVQYGWKKENMPLYHLYLLIEGPGLILLYRFRMKGHPFEKTFVWLAGGFALFVILNAIFTEDLFDLPVFVRTVEGWLLVNLGVVHFRSLFTQQKVMHLERSFWFWISSGLILYFASNAMLFMFTNELRKQKDLFLAVWSIHAVLNFVLYAFYSIALLCRDQES